MGKKTNVIIAASVKEDQETPETVKIGGMCIVVLDTS